MSDNPNKPIGIEDIPTEELAKAYTSLTNGDTPPEDRDGLLFCFHTADVLYLQKQLDGSWKDVTPEGIEGAAKIRRNTDDSLTIKIPEKPRNN